MFIKERRPMDMEKNMKVVGRRRPRDQKTAGEYDILQKTAQALRGNRGICPKGVYRFRSFKEANEWMIKMLAKHDRRH
jgi:hypothetical protein